MAKNIDFSPDLGKPADPVSPNGQLLVSAGRLEGESAAQGGAFKAAVTQQVAGLAMDAGKGFLESNLEKDTRRTVDAYEARVKTDDATLTLDLFNSGMVENNPVEVEKAKADIQKYKDALDQGIMTREQALLQIDRSVKQYSRVMPGWASDFRKLAGKLTGIEHMGAYAEHNLLSKASASEKLRADQLDFLQKTAQKQITMFVERFGRMPVGGLQGDDMKVFREQLTISANADALKKQIEMRDSTIAQNEPRVTNYVNHRMADGMMTLSTLMQGIVTGVDPTSGKPFSSESKILLRQNLLSNVNTFFEKVKTEVLGFNTNQVSNATREQLMTRLNTQQKELVDSLKNQDNFDDFRKTMELRASKAADVMAQWAIANPHLKIIKESGIATPEVAKLWIDSQREPRRQTEFRRIYGGALDDYFKSITSGGVAMSNYHSSNMTGASQSEDHMASLRTTNPGAYQAAVLGLRDHIKSIAQGGWGDSQETQDLRKSKFADNVRVFAAQINLSDEASVKEWTTLMGDPRVAARIKELPQAEAATAPVMMKTREVLENPEFGVMARINRLAEKLEVTHKNKAFDLIQDPATGQIKVQYYPWEGVAANSQPGMGKRGRKMPVVGDGRQVGDDGPELARLVATANRALAVMNNFQEGLPGDLQGGSLAKDTVEKFSQGYFGLSVEGRQQFLEDRGGDPEKKEKKSKSGESGDDFNKEANEAWGDPNDPKVLENAAKIRLKEVGGHAAAAELVIQDIENTLKVPEAQGGPKSDYRRILQRELATWQKAKELATAKALPTGDNGEKKE